MSFWDFLEKTRRHSEQQKRRIAFFLTVIATVLIIIAWLSVSFVSSGKAIKTQAQNPFSVIKQFLFFK